MPLAPTLLPSRERTLCTSYLLQGYGRIPIWSEPSTSVLRPQEVAEGLASGRKNKAPPATDGSGLVGQSNSPEKPVSGHGAEQAAVHALNAIEQLSPATSRAASQAARHSSLVASFGQARTQASKVDRAVATQTVMSAPHP